MGEYFGREIFAQIANRLVALDLERVQRAFLRDRVRHPHKHLLNVRQRWYRQANVHERLERHRHVIAVSLGAPHG